MFFRFIALAMLAFGLGAAAPAMAAIVGDASVPYSAARVVTVDGKKFTGREYHTAGKQRHDVDVGGIPMSFILDFDDHDGSVILPALVSYIDFPLPPLLAELDRRRVERWAVGPDTVEGMPATKYRIDYVATDGTRGDGFFWLSRDNILLRIEGRIVRRGHSPMVVAMRLSNIKFGPQPPELFHKPKGLHKIPEGALEMLLNLRTKTHR